ncbi:fungal specific transcription factor domain-containing protein 3 [Elsinoe australis]|uniref:Fungal specific transcription factor domain-containing protein 3 n=1 Tax=Elsinoe australis TaxID=40998 RepID=A0A4V6DVD6_9PEZI|nr:fungal specific transcription factor domain-containing protein 3 [Elsinoe australis]
MAAAVVMPPLTAQPSPRPSSAPRPPTAKSLSKHNKTAQKEPTTADGKRVRAERPCDGCRRRKSKCVIQESGSPCVLCKFHKQDCTFLEGPLPRKRRVEEPTKDDTPTKVMKTSHKGAPHAGGPNGVLDDTAAMAPSRDIQATLDDTLSLQRHRHCRHVGASSALDMSLLEHCQFGIFDETKLDCGDIRRVSENGFFEMLPDAAFATYEDELQALYDVEQIVAPNGPALIDLYFEKVHPNFPIIQKRVFLDRHRHGDRQFSSALLAAMYILAIRWWSQDPILAQHPIPSVQALEIVAMRSLNVAMQRPKLSSLQAGLLLLQKHHSNAWPLTVQLVALSQDLGLHLDCSDWSIPLWERRLRKRLAWAMYMQDKWASLVYGRPSHVHASNWSVPSLQLDDFNEDVSDAPSSATESPTSSSTDIAIFLQMVELTSIMSSVVDTFYTLSGQQATSSTHLILSKAKPVQLQLKEWFSRLPSFAKMDAPDAPPSVGYLHLAYFATEISIHRRIVQSLSLSGPPDNYALYICRSAAKTRLISAMDFVNRLKPEHLDSFWYFPSAHNFALIATFGNLLRATAPGQEEACFYEMRLREYRWALSVSSRRAKWIGIAIGTLDVTGRMLEGMPEKPRSGEGTPRSRADSARAGER